MGSDRPDMSRFERWFLTGQLTSVRRLPICRGGFVFLRGIHLSFLPDCKNTIMHPPAAKPHDLAAYAPISVGGGTDAPRCLLFDDLRPDRFVNGRFSPEPEGTKLTQAV